MDTAVLRLGALMEELHRGEGKPDPAFVRAFARWLHEKAAHFALEPIERLGLHGVVVTFYVKQRLKMVVTGYMPDQLPGEVTLRIDEDEFADVVVFVTTATRPDPYDVCTMDYTLAGTRVRVTRGPQAGRAGTLVVAATIGERQENLIALDGDKGEVEIDGHYLERLD